jgi:membrane-anchored protein YejM (alkaline phosphatase superfamily)
MLGFSHFEAAEDIKGEMLGYLSSDDESIPAALARWLDKKESGAPFIATILTSAAHHPYRLSKRIEERLRLHSRPSQSERERYARLVEAEDRMIGETIDILEKRSLIDSTLIIVVGDHGEGFGAFGVKQHDNNFFEEGLRVPLVFSGPGVPVRQIEENTSLVDVTPSTLSLLGIELSPSLLKNIEGQNVFSNDLKTKSAKYFFCYYENFCRGFVLDDEKYVFFSKSQSSWKLNVPNDVSSFGNFHLAPELSHHVQTLEKLMRRRPSEQTYQHLELSNWQCRENEGCHHISN